jgi:hypothetical protein
LEWNAETKHLIVAPSAHESFFRFFACSAMSADPPEDETEEPLFDPAWSRPANSYGTFRRGKDTEAADKRLEERGFAEDALSGGGFAFTALRSCEVDPPDCEAIVDGNSTGIEVTELVEGATLAHAREALKLPPSDVFAGLRRHEYREWTREDFLVEVQALIKKKNSGNWKGGPYQRQMLVIHTDETTLGPGTVKRFLDGERFAFGFFSDVVVVLSYDPHTQTHPAFRLLSE